MSIIYKEKKISLKIWFAIITNLGLFIFIALWLKNHIQEHALIKDIHQISFLSILITSLLSLVLLITYSIRLKSLLKKPIFQLFEIVSIGHGSNSLLPFRLGDAFRILFAKRVYGIDLINGFMSLFIEKFLDAITILIIASVFLLRNINILRISGIYLFIIGLMPLFFVGLFFCLRKNNSLLRAILQRVKFLINIRDFLQNICYKQNIYKLLINTILIWLTTFCIFYSFFKLNLHNTFHLLDALVLMGLTTLSLGFPSAFANLGIFESVIVFYLIKYNAIRPDIAVSLALAFHIINALPQVILVFFILFQRRKKLWNLPDVSNRHENV